MDLAPKLPPGRSNRKALAFGAEIHRLRSAGYSFEAIRLALLDAGVAVSRTTVKREAARRRATPPTATQARATQPHVSSLPSRAAEVVHALPFFAGDSRTGKEIAEAFMKDRISNPLMQPKDKP